MKLLTVVLNSIGRRKRRAILVMIGIAFSVAIIISITGLTRSYTRIVQSSFQPYHGKIVVTHKSARFFEAMPSQTILEPELGAELEQVEGVERISPVSMRTYGATDSLIPAILVGMNIDDHNFIYPQLIVYPTGRWPVNPGEVVIGISSPYHLQGSRVGDTISVYGTNLTVIGILWLTEIRIYNSFIIVDLEFYYELTRSRFVSIFLVQTDESNSQDDVAEHIEAVAPHVNALTNDEQGVLVDNIISKVQKWNSYIGSLAALMSISLITTIQYLTILQRQREFGTMKAIGASNLMMIRMILLESLVVGVLGCLLGMLIGFGGAYGIVYLYNRSSLIIAARLTFQLLSWSTMILAFVIGLVVAVISSILPMKRVIDLDPIVSISNPDI